MNSYQITSLISLIFKNEWGGEGGEGGGGETQMKLFHLSTGFAGHAEAATLTDLQLHLQPGLFWEVLPHRCVCRRFTASEK